MVLRVSHGPACGAGCSGILHEKAAFFEGGTSAGPLSIKSMTYGTAFYETEGRAVHVGPERYLILNDGQPYFICIDAEQPVESFCVFFDSHFAAGVLRSLTAPDEALLNEPESTSPGVRFFDRLYPHDDMVTPVLSRMRAASAAGTLRVEQAEETLHLLMERLLAVHHRARAEADGVPAIRSATRYEIYRRLHHARDYMEARIGEPTSIGEIASVAAMAPHHFLRRFKQLFGESPHQYLKRRRLKRAARLIATTDMPITRVGLEVGFESLGAFSWIFRKRYGLSPEGYRAAMRSRK